MCGAVSWHKEMRAYRYGEIHIMTYDKGATTTNRDIGGYRAQTLDAMFNFENMFSLFDKSSSAPFSVLDPRLEQWPYARPFALPGCPAEYIFTVFSMLD